MVFPNEAIPPELNKILPFASIVEISMFMLVAVNTEDNADSPLINIETAQTSIKNLSWLSCVHQRDG